MRIPSGNPERRIERASLSFHGRENALSSALPPSGVCEEEARPRHITFIQPRESSATQPGVRLESLQHPENARFLRIPARTMAPSSTVSSKRSNVFCSINMNNIPGWNRKNCNQFFLRWKILFMYCGLDGFVLEIWGSLYKAKKWSNVFKLLSFF